MQQWIPNKQTYTHTNKLTELDTHLTIFPLFQQNVPETYLAIMEDIWTNTACASALMGVPPAARGQILLNTHAPPYLHTPPPPGPAAGTSTTTTPVLGGQHRENAN